MKTAEHKKAAKTGLICSLIVFMSSTGTGVTGLSAQNRPANPPEGSRPQMARTLRAPDTMPGTTFEMREPAYWISTMKEPDAVIATVEEIHSRNMAFKRCLADIPQIDSDVARQVNQELRTRPGLFTSMPDLESLTAEEISAMTTAIIEKELTMLNGRRSTNILGIPYSDMEIKTLGDEMALAAIPEQIKPLPAVTVKNTRLRIIPALRPEYVGSSSWDMWNFDILPIASPVHILHTSNSGGFLFVLSERGLGWISSEDAAFSSQAEINKIVKSNHFIICTGERIPYYSDSECGYASGWLRMGDRIPADENNPRIILLPTRKVNGMLDIQAAWLKEDADVNKGYLPYTRRNIVLQAFKLLDNIYDWTGGWYGRDHATQLRDIFSVFGFKLPSMGGMITALSEDPGYISPSEGLDAQYKAILSHEPFITIQICSSGHSQLLLGEYYGTPIVFDTHGYRYPDKDGNDLVIRRANVGTVAFPDYFLKQTVAFLEMK